MGFWREVPENGEDLWSMASRMGRLRALRITSLGSSRTHLRGGYSLKPSSFPGDFYPAAEARQQMMPSQKGTGRDVIWRP